MRKQMMDAVEVAAHVGPRGLKVCVAPGCGKPASRHRSGTTHTRYCAMHRKRIERGGGLCSTQETRIRLVKQALKEGCTEKEVTRIFNLNRNYFSNWRKNGWL